MQTIFSAFLRIGILFVLLSCTTMPHAVVPTTTHIQVTAKPIEIKNSLFPEMHLQCIQYTVPFKIVQYLLDPQKMQICFTAEEPNKSGTGPVYLILYDLSKNEIMWTRKAYVKDFTFTDDKLVIEGFKSSWKSFGLDRMTGDVCWERDISWYYPMESDIAFSGLLTAIDLNTGQDLWYRKIKNEFGWIERDEIGDDLLAAVDGLHKFNFKTGKGWSKEMQTGKSDRAKAAGMNTFTFLLGGVYVAPDKITGLCSNIFRKGNRIYFSAMDDLYCIDYDTGNEIWHTQLPEKKTGETFIFSTADKLVFINKGSSYRNGISQKYGLPYLAIFDTTSGQKLAWAEIDVESPIQDIIENKTEGFYLLSGESILFYDYRGELKCKSVTDNGPDNEFETNIKFTKNQSYYTTMDSDKNQYQSIYNLKKDPDEITIRTTRKLSFIDEQCSSVRSIPVSEVKQLFAVTNEYYLLNNDPAYIPGSKNTVDYTLSIISHEGKSFGEYVLPAFARNTIKVLSADTTKFSLFYLIDFKSFAICPLSDFNAK